MLFKSDEINKIKEDFENFKSDKHIVFPYIDDKFNEVRRTEEREIETFRCDFSSPANAVIGWEGQDMHYAYSEGFFNIAHNAIVPAHTQSDILIYPIIFNYRHYLELVLKEYISKFENVFRYKSKFNQITHNLDELLKQLMKILEAQKLGFLISSKQKKVIRDFHNIDRKNDAFRYIYDKRGNLNHNYKHERIDLLNVHFTMNEVYNDFKALEYIFNQYFTKLYKKKRE